MVVHGARATIPPILHSPNGKQKNNHRHCYWSGGDGGGATNNIFMFAINQARKLLKILLHLRK